MERLWHDLRFTLRSLIRTPVFTIAAILSLALGIGVNTAIFSFVDAMFLRGVPVEDPSTLRTIYTKDPKVPGWWPVSYPNYEDLLTRVEGGDDTVVDALAYRIAAFSMIAEGEPERVQAEMVTANYFSVLGVPIAEGRGLDGEGGDVLGTEPLIVLRHAYWQQRFGGDPGVIGRSVSLNGQPFTIAGVAPEGFSGVRFAAEPDLWVPMRMRRELLSGRMAQGFGMRQAMLLSVVVRAQPNASPAQIETTLARLSADLERDHPDTNRGRTFETIALLESSIHPRFRGGYVRGGQVLTAVVGFILLIACANVANLLLARAVSRRKEFAIRLAIGVGGGRLVRQLLTESLVLAFLGALVALPLAVVTRNLLWGYRPPSFPSDLAIGLDWRILGFTLLIATVTGVLFGLVPALQAVRTDMVTALKEEAPPRAGGRRRPTLRAILVVLQVALSTVTLIGAGLFLRSLSVIENRDPGFETERLLMVGVDPGAQRYTPDRIRNLYDTLEREAGALAGVEVVGLAEKGPLAGGGFLRRVQPVGLDDSGDPLVLGSNRVTPGYFEAFGIQVEGQAFTDADRADTRPVAVVNRTLAERFWPDKSAIGSQIRLSGSQEPFEIIGIARDAKYVSLGEQPQPYVYTALRQDVPTEAVLYVRTAGDPAALRGPVESLLRREASDLPPIDLRTIGEVLEAAPWGLRMGAVFLSLFGALALILTSLGIYGVMAYGVSQRQREIATRVALGATPGSILNLVVRGGLALVVIGLVIGTVVAVFLTRSISRFLFVEQLIDPPSFIAASVIFLLVALIATVVPGVRAMRTSPALVLKDR
ncbi:MAG: ABC transporter permease [Acidobacteriota bacterium]